MNGINSNRLATLDYEAYKTGVNYDDMEEAYYDFASKAEDEGMKVRHYDLLVPYGETAVPAEIKKLDGETEVMACACRGRYAKEGKLIIGPAVYRPAMADENGNPQFRPNLVIFSEGKDKDPTIVKLSELGGLYVQQPENYAEGGYAKKDVMRIEADSDENNFMEEAIAADAEERVYWPNTDKLNWYELEKLDGEQVLAVKGNKYCEPVTHIKGKAKYDGENEPALSIEIADGVCCKVSFSDMSRLYVNGNGKDKDYSSWRVLPKHYEGIPDYVYDARVNLVSPQNRANLKQALEADPELKMLYFGGDLYGDGSYTKAAIRTIGRLSVSKYVKSEKEVRDMIRGSAWYRIGDHDEEILSAVSRVYATVTKDKSPADKKFHGENEK